MSESILKLVAQNGLPAVLSVTCWVAIVAMALVGLSTIMEDD